MNKIHFLMLALETSLRRWASPYVTLFAELVTSVEDLENELTQLNQNMLNLQAQADGENRRLNAEEELRMTTLLNSFEQVEEEITRRERIAATTARLSQSRGRQTEPNLAGDAGDDLDVDTNPRRASARAAAPRRDTGVSVRDRADRDIGKRGFRSFGEFAQQVHKAAIPGNNHSLDPRLRMDTAPTSSNEGSGPDGGFAIPPDFRQEILEKVTGEASLIGRTDQLQSSSNSITIPKDETTPWQSTGGVTAAWEGEAKQIGGSKIALDQTVIRLNKLTAMVNITSELLEDAPALSTYIRRKAPIKIDYKITDAIVNGTGVGMPLGLMKSDAKISIAKESAQTASTIVFANIVKMWAQVYSGCRQNLVWLINQDIEPQLLSLQFPGSGTAVPVYLPPGGLSGNPYGLLMGKPVIPTEACGQLGSEGDIIAADLSAYMTATKVGGGMRQDVSMHLYFDYDLMAFRFIVRVAGQPWWSSAITPANGSNKKRSCIVTLADRS